MPRTLKVYQAQIGFYDLIVAAPSQAAALRAWGIHLNMFADGSARIATDKQAIKAALAQPETPLKRAVGTHDPFSSNPGLPHFSDFPKGEKKPRPNGSLLRSRAPPIGSPSTLQKLTCSESSISGASSRKVTQSNMPS